MLCMHWLEALLAYVIDQHFRCPACTDWTWCKQHKWKPTVGKQHIKTRSTLFQHANNNQTNKKTRNTHGAHTKKTKTKALTAVWILREAQKWSHGSSNRMSRRLTRRTCCLRRTNQGHPWPKIQMTIFQIILYPHFAIMTWSMSSRWGFKIRDILR